MGYKDTFTMVQDGSPETGIKKQKVFMQNEKYLIFMQKNSRRLRVPENSHNGIHRKPANLNMIASYYSLN